MAYKTQEGEEAAKYVDTLVKYSKQGAGFKLAEEPLKMALPKFREDYKAKPTSKDKREPEFNTVAAKFLNILYGAGFDSPDIAGGMLKKMLEKAPEGTAGKLYGAIEKGDQYGIEEALKLTVESSYQNNKLETTVADWKNQIDPLKTNVAKGLASILGDVNDFKGSYLSILENPTVTLQGLQQRLAIAEGVAETKPAEK